MRQRKSHGTVSHTWYFQRSLGLSMRYTHIAIRPGDVLTHLKMLLGFFSDNKETYINGQKIVLPQKIFKLLISHQRSTMSKFWQPAPQPKTGLGVYRVLSPNAGVRVSPIQLGAMSIGDKWDKIGMGSMDKESSFKLLDAYFDNGGNFIDTANS